MIRKITAAIAAIVLFAPGAALARGADDVITVSVCYHFGCNDRQHVTISDDEWQQVANWFRKEPEDAADERERIKNAVGWLEVVIGRYTPIHLDLGQDQLTASGLGQMDCIDEEKNVTGFLRLFERKGLLRFHRVVEPAYRRTAWDQHWAGQIEDISNGDRWVVDSWFQAYGFNPYIQEVGQWKDIPFFFSSSYIDNSPD